MSVSTLSSKNQISIPRDLRQRKGWRPGQRFSFVVRAEGVMLVPVPEREDLEGMAIGAPNEDYRDRDDRF